MMDDLRIDLSDFGASADEASRARSKEGPARRPRRMRRVVAGLALLCMLGVAPFLLLLRGGVHAHTAWGWSTWPALAAGVSFACLALSLFTWGALTLLRLRGRVRRVLSRGALLVGAAYASYGLLYVAARNTKGAEVRAEYRALHPLLRLAATTLFLVDGDAVVTDAARAPEDYAAMGVPPAERSLHFPQDDGYVHALDVRTVGRHGLRNFLLESGFRVMGFRTLRHVGTADHLHVSLPSRGGSGGAE